MNYEIIKDFNNGASSVKKFIVLYNDKTCLLRKYDKRFMDKRIEALENAKILYENGVLVPQIYSIKESEAIIEWIDGVSLDKLLVSREEEIKYGILVSGELKKMHSVKPKEQIDIYSSYIKSLNKKVKRLKELGIDFDTRIIDFAISNIGVLKGKNSSIVHGDFHPGNIVISNNKPYFIDLDVCKNGFAWYDFSSYTCILKYEEFYKSVINSYFDECIPEDMFIIYNLYGVLYVLDYLFYSYRMGNNDGEKVLNEFLKDNSNFKSLVPLWYKDLNRKDGIYERIKKI